MITRRRSMFLAFGLLSFPVILQAKGIQGFALLKGRIQGASVSADVLSFKFSGQLSFSFFTAEPEDPARQQVDMRFDVRDLRVEVPRFGEERYPDEDNPTLVSFGNAVRHAQQAAESGEIVTAKLFRPVFSYDIHSVIEKIACMPAQIMPESTERRWRNDHR